LFFLEFCGYNGGMAGRPKKPEAEKRTNTLRIRLAEAERERLDKAAEEKGLETSTWARSELLALAKRLLGGK
jgi:hypothetical protein